MSLKITVHTKTGKKLSYYPVDWADDSQAKQWWLQAIDISDYAVQFGHFIIDSSNIDFVEFRMKRVTKKVIGTT